MRIAVYGASGHTGRLVVAELVRRKLDVVLVGRSLARLREVGPYETRVAPLGSLADAFTGCEVVINCVAPFVRYGAPVVRAAVAAGAHYLDISGEQGYIKEIFDTFGSQAQAAGVAVVPMVNDGGGLADLLVSLLAGDSASEIVIAHRITGSGGMSRGSGRTALANKQSWSAGGLTYVDGSWRTGMSTRHAMIDFPGDSTPSPVVKAAMPEVVTIPRHVDAEYVEGVGDAVMLDLFTRITPELVAQLPEAPAGGGEFTLVASVSGKRGVITGFDTYRATAVIAAEAATRLSTQSGVLAPAQAFPAPDFLESLAPFGVHLDA
jgi:short subunit dehydrogenase-like uncharacterized protein